MEQEEYISERQYHLLIAALIAALPLLITAFVRVQELQAMIR